MVDTTLMAFKGTLGMSCSSAIPERSGSRQQGFSKDANCLVINAENSRQSLLLIVITSNKTASNPGADQGLAVTTLRTGAAWSGAVFPSTATGPCHAGTFELPP